MEKLPAEFYGRRDVVAVARDLLGKTLCTDIGGQRCRAVVTETEAYAGVDDRASHAWAGRRTARTEPMYAAGGCAYVYLCYGIHHLFNVVTGPAGTPHAVLVRAVQAVDGVAAMLERRGRERADRRLLTGPGNVAQALGITTALSGISLCENAVWIEEGRVDVRPADVRSSPRIGVDYAGDHAGLPYRFVLRPESPVASSGATGR